MEKRGEKEGYTLGPMRRGVPLCASNTRTTEGAEANNDTVAQIRVYRSDYLQRRVRLIGFTRADMTGRRTVAKMHDVRGTNKRIEASASVLNANALAIRANSDK